MDLTASGSFLGEKNQFWEHLGLNASSIIVDNTTSEQDPCPLWTCCLAHKMELTASDDWVLRRPNETKGMAML
jgi:hypothetical protein